MRVGLAILPALASIVLAGCQSPRTSGLALEVATATDGRPGLATLRIDDTTLARHVEMRQVASSRSASGFLILEAELANVGDRDYPCQYKFVWFCEDGLSAAGAPRPWEQTVIHGGETVRVRGVAHDPRATKAVVQVRRIN